MKVEKQIISESPWQSLKQYTQASVALGRCGCSIPTRELLSFKLAHAKAIDAVRSPLDYGKVASHIRQATGLETLHVSSAAEDRQQYLQRPDLGRTLSFDSAHQLSRISGNGPYDIALVVADGLSSKAIENNIIPMLTDFVPQLKAKGFSMAPVTVVEQGRVAIADQIGEILNALMSIIFIGERPGLKSPDGLGIYLTYNPRSGTTDERRNCISNVRKNGLAYQVACSKLLYLIEESFRRKLSGVELKDEQTSLEHVCQSVTLLTSSLQLDCCSEGLLWKGKPRFKK